MSDEVSAEDVLGGHRKKLQALGWSTAYTHTNVDYWALHAQKGFVRIRVQYVEANEERAEKVTFRATLSDLTDVPRETHWRKVADEEDFWEYVHTFDHGLLIEPQVSLVKADEPEAPRPVKPPKPVCQCGKHRFDYDAAHEALLKAKIARALRGNRRRREQRVYECPTLPDVFHLTSWAERHKPGTITGP